MATLPPEKLVLGDTGSDEVFLLRRAFNHLLQAICTTGLTDVPSLAAQLLLDPAIVQVVNTREIPSPRQFPTKAGTAP